VLAGHQGFGLTSMRQRVQALGGQLAIETGRGGTSIPGVGCRPSRARHPTEAQVTRPRVMVADDHRQFREALVALLEWAALAAGATAYVAKDANLEVLRATLAAATPADRPAPGR
jgi:hypothetical protein